MRRGRFHKTEKSALWTILCLTLYAFGEMLKCRNDKNTAQFIVGWKCPTEMISATLMIALKSQPQESGDGRLRAWQHNGACSEGNCWLWALSPRGFPSTAMQTGSEAWGVVRVWLTTHLSILSQEKEAVLASNIKRCYSCTWEGVMLALLQLWSQHCSRISWRQMWWRPGHCYRYFGASQVIGLLKGALWGVAFWKSFQHFNKHRIRCPNWPPRISPEMAALRAANVIPGGFLLQF